MKTEETWDGNESEEHWNDGDGIVADTKDIEALDNRSETMLDDTANDAVLAATAELEAARLDLAQAEQGFSLFLDLSTKMGMVINPDNTVSKVVENGQAANSGVRPGCQIFWAGDCETSSLDELKRAISDAKLQGAAALTVFYKDPRRLFRLKAEEARLKALVSKAFAEAAAQEARRAQERAEEEAAAAKALAEANAKARQDAEEESRRLFEENELARQRAKEEADALLVANEMAREQAEREQRELAEAAERARAAAEAEVRELEEQRRAVLEEAKAAALERQQELAEAQANEELNRKLKERKPGSASIQLSILSAKGVLARDANGFSDVYAVAEVIDLLTGRAVDSETTTPHRTRTVKRTVDPFWLERVNWADVPLTPSALAVRVKLFDRDRWSVEPLGQVTLPLLDPDASPDEEENAGSLRDRDLWYALGPSPKMKVASTGEVQLRLAWNEFRLFDCAVCGKFNSKSAKNTCRCCGSKARRQPNPNISEDPGTGRKLHQLWVKRRREKFSIEREPLPALPPELQVLDDDESAL